MVTVILDYMRATAATCDPVPRERLVTFPVDAVLHVGGRPWQVYHAPGHTYHQTIFYQSQTRQLLSADMLLRRTPTSVVECPPDGRQRVPGLPQFLESLALVEGLAIDVVYPGHGEPFSDYRQIIRQQRARIMQRKQECLDWVRQGYDTAVALAQKMYADRPTAVQFVGLWMLIGYLDLLLADGMIEVQAIDEVLHYVPTGSEPFSAKSS